MDNNQQKEELIKEIKLQSGIMKYIHFGNKEGKPIIILPGLSLQSVLKAAEAIVSAYEHLAKDYDVYLFDHLDIVPQGYSVNDMANDCIEAINQLNIDKVNLMGVSLGGMISQVIALKNPELVIALALCSSTSDVTKGGMDTFTEWKELALQRKTRELANTICERIYSDEFNEQYKEAIITINLNTTELEFQNFLNLLEAIMTFDISNRIKEIKSPVIVLGGLKDKVWGVQASMGIVEKLNCEYYIYEDQGHSVYDEASDFQVHVKDFLDKVEYNKY